MDENDDDALLSARELLGCVLYGLEEEARNPRASQLKDVSVAENEHTRSWTCTCHRSGKPSRARRLNRTVTLPAWLNSLAVEHNVNFSQTLQAALRDQLKVH